MILAFHVFAALALLSALVILFTRNLMYAALSLFITLLSVAALFVLANADFLAVTQLLIYVGGILILLIFGVMLSSKDRDDNSQTQNKINTPHQNQLMGGVIGLSVFGLLYWLIHLLNLPAPLSAPRSTVTQFGMAFMTSHSLIFEVAGILLLMALVGATYLATEKK